MQETTFAEAIPQKSLRDILAILFRHRKPAIICFSVIVTAVAVGTMIAPKIYKSDAKLLAKLGRENLTMDPTMGNQQIVSISQSRESQINSELEILQSREVIGRVIDKLGPEVFLGRKKAIEADATPGREVGSGASESSRTADREAAMQRFMDSLQVELLRESNIITVSFSAHDPALAQAVISELIDFYLTKHIDAHRTRGARGFFIQQTEQYRQALSGTEQELRDLKNSTSIGSLGEQRNILLNRIGVLQTRIQETETSLSASRAKVDMLQKMVGGLPETLVTQKTSGAPNPAAASMRSKIYELQLREQDLLSKFKEDTEIVREVRRQIGEAKALLGKEESNVTEETTGINTTRGKVMGDFLAERASLSALEAAAPTLRQEFARAQNDLRVLNETEVKMAQLERQLVMQRDNYSKYSEKNEQARIDEELEKDRISNISVIQAATYSSIPVSPRRTLNLLVGLVLGIFGGLATVFVLDAVDQSVKSPLDVQQKLHLRMLASVPRLDTKSVGLLRLHSETVPAMLPPSLEVVAAEDREDSLVVVANNGAYGENQWDHLASFVNGVAQKPCVLSITSCHAGEGVSTVAASIAATLQRDGVERVLLVDVKAIRRSNHSGHLVLPSSAVKSLGRPPADAHQPYEARTNADLIELLKRDGSFVVLDLPPVLEKASTIRFCCLADGVVLVVKAETTRWHVAQEAKERLQQANANLLGVILNERRFYVPDWLYRKL